MSDRPIFVGSIHNGSAKLSTSATAVDGTGSTLLFTADVANGSRIHALTAVPTNNLSAAVVARFFILNGGVYTIIAEKAIPAYTQATGAAAPVTNFMEFADMPFLDPTDKFLSLAAGEKLYVALLATPTNQVHISAMGGDY